MENFIGINRGIIDHWIYRDADYFKAWFEMLVRARFSQEPVREMIEGQLVQINYGEFIFGRSKWSQRLGISEQRLRTLIKKLVDADMLELTSRNPKFSLYRIKNYAKYNHQSNQHNSASDKGFQDSSTSRATNDQPAPNQQLTSRATTKEDSKERKIENIDKNVIEERYAYADTVYLTHPQYDQLVNDFDKEQVDLYIEKLDEYQTNNPKKAKKDHYKTIRVWIQKDLSDGRSNKGASYKRSSKQLDNMEFLMRQIEMEVANGQDPAKEIVSDYQQLLPEFRG